jgi:hypothetical protein
MLSPILIVAAIFGLGLAAGYGMRAAIAPRELGGVSTDGEDTPVRTPPAHTEAKTS